MTLQNHREDFSKALRRLFCTMMKIKKNHYDAFFQPLYRFGKGIIMV
jgi:hypothetical protein